MYYYLFHDGSDSPSCIIFCSLEYNCLDMINFVSFLFILTKLSLAINFDRITMGLMWPRSIGIGSILVPCKLRYSYLKNMILLNFMFLAGTFLFLVCAILMFLVHTIYFLCFMWIWSSFQFVSNSEGDMRTEFFLKIY
jgi:hypothetical protein